MINMSNWKDVGNKGILRFIVVNGILSFGIPMVILTAIVRFYFGSPGTDSWREYLLSNGTWIGYILQAVTTGAIIGAVIWFLNKRSFRSPTKSESEIDEA